MQSSTYWITLSVESPLNQTRKIISCYGWLALYSARQMHRCEILKSCWAMHRCNIMLCRQYKCCARKWQPDQSINIGTLYHSTRTARRGGFALTPVLEPVQPSICRKCNFTGGTCWLTISQSGRQRWDAREEIHREMRTSALRRKPCFCVLSVA